MTKFELIFALSLALFSIGLIGVCIRRNLIVLFMCIELMLNSINLMIINFSKYNQNSNGEAIVVFVMVVAAAEAAVGLALVLNVFRHKQTVEINNLNSLQR